MRIYREVPQLILFFWLYDLGSGELSLLPSGNMDYSTLVQKQETLKDLSRFCKALGNFGGSPSHQLMLELSSKIALYLDINEASYSELFNEEANIFGRLRSILSDDFADLTEGENQESFREMLLLVPGIVKRSIYGLIGGDSREGVSQGQALYFEDEQELTLDGIDMDITLALRPEEGRSDTFPLDNSPSSRLAVFMRAGGEDLIEQYLEKINLLESFSKEHKFSDLYTIVQLAQTSTERQLKDEVVVPVKSFPLFSLSPLQECFNETLIAYDLEGKNSITQYDGDSVLKINKTSSFYIALNNFLSIVGAINKGIQRSVADFLFEPYPSDNGSVLISRDLTPDLFLMYNLAVIIEAEGMDTVPVAKTTEELAKHFRLFLLEYTHALRRKNAKDSCKKWMLKALGISIAISNLMNTKTPIVGASCIFEEGVPAKFNPKISEAYGDLFVRLNLDAGNFPLDETMSYSPTAQVMNILGNIVNEERDFANNQQVLSLLEKVRTEQDNFHGIQPLGYASIKDVPSTTLGYLVMVVANCIDRTPLK